MYTNTALCCVHPKCVHTVPNQVRAGQRVLIIVLSVWESQVITTTWLFHAGGPQAVKCLWGLQEQGDAVWVGEVRAPHGIGGSKSSVLLCALGLQCLR